MPLLIADVEDSFNYCTQLSDTFPINHMKCGILVGFSGSYKAFLYSMCSSHLSGLAYAVAFLLTWTFFGAVGRIQANPVWQQTSFSMVYVAGSSIFTKIFFYD